MDDTSQASTIALCLGAVFLIAAAVATLLQLTRDVPITRRPRRMANLAWSGFVSVLPPRWVVMSVVAGLLAFVGSLLLGLVVTILIIRAIPPDVPNPTEAYEGIGDAIKAMMYFSLGASLSLFIAGVVGLLVGSWVASRQGEPVISRSM